MKMKYQTEIEEIMKKTLEFLKQTQPHLDELIDDIKNLAIKYNGKKEPEEQKEPKL